MEMTLMLTGLTVGGFLAFPAIIDFARKNKNMLLTPVVLLAFLYVSAPFSPETRNLWDRISNIPGSAYDCTLDSIAKLRSEYYGAFHG